MQNVNSIVIVGAGQAGASAVSKLRSLGYEGRLVLIGDEPVLPYQRPPLSKKYLLGEVSAENLQLKSVNFYEKQNVELYLGTQVTEIDCQHKIIATSKGDRISWDKLLIATGSMPRTLPQSIINGFEHVYTVRTLLDVDVMSPMFKPGKRVLIVGGGYIGLEAASIARKCGVETTLIEAAPRILQRVSAQETAERFVKLHRQNDVDVRENTTLKSLSHDGGWVCTALLGDGSRVEVDFVIAGIGVIPGSALAEKAEIRVDNGIALDAFCRSSNPDVFAAGDCASFPWQGQRIRLESVQNAIDQAETAALNMLGQEQEYDPVPWFWSDQYEVKLQIAGLNIGYDNVITRPGAREGASSVWYFNKEKFLAVDAFNDPAAFMVAKRLLAAKISPPRNQVSDPEVPVKSLMSATGSPASRRSVSM